MPTPEAPTATAAAPPFIVWAFGDAHVGTDKRAGRESLADALRQSEKGGGPRGGPPFDWTLAVDVGDMSGGQDTPKDPEGTELVRQLTALQKHRREDIYSVCGNHDRSGLDEPAAWWWRKWVDPLGENTTHSGVRADRRPFPITGTWERYSFRAGNLLFLMMSDINEPSQKLGRGTLGGNPAGVVSGETFAWWRRMVEENPKSIIISVHHYVLKDTTTASGEFEGLVKAPDGTWKSHYHGCKPEGAPQGASYLYFVDSKADAQAFEGYLAAHPGAVAVWIGGHTHTVPDDTCGNKPLVATKWGTHFINCAALSQHHKCQGVSTAPMSRVLTFTPGRDRLRVQCYLHTADYAPQGWYDKVEQTLVLPRPFVPPPR